MALVFPLLFFADLDTNNHGCLHVRVLSTMWIFVIYASVKIRMASVQANPKSAMTQNNAPA